MAPAGHAGQTAHMLKHLRACKQEQRAACLFERWCACTWEGRASEPVMPGGSDAPSSQGAPAPASTTWRGPRMRRSACH